MDIAEDRSDRSNVFLAGSVLCALAFGVLFYYRLELCHSFFPLTFSLVGLPLLGTLLGGRAFFDPKSGWAMVLAKVAIICTNVAQLGMGLLSLTGLGLFNCG